ncbi:MAG: hypothetical protein HFE51_04365 [Clostridia bacterium]|nr:hypothetical protein [Clostridia bacterium]
MNVKQQLSDAEIYCAAKILQSVIFAPGHTLFYGCRYCKHKEECMPEHKPHPDMIFDRLRKDLQNITGVDLDMMSKVDKFQDNITTE